jgi:hypothetical protein
MDEIAQRDITPMRARLACKGNPSAIRLLTRRASEVLPHAIVATIRICTAYSYCFVRAVDAEMGVDTFSYNAKSMSDTISLFFPKP